MTKISKSILGVQKLEMITGLRSYYKNIATTLYKWDNMPEEIPIRYPEKTLYENGMSVFLEVPGAGFACLPVMTGSIQKNMYGEPAEWRALAIGDFASLVNNLKLNSDNSVLIYNDNDYRPTFPYVDVLIKQLVNVEITTRMNVNAQKNPMWFKTNDMNVLQNKNTFKEWFEGEPVFFKTSLSADEFDFINPSIPFIGNELADLYNVYNYRILGYLGIDNAGVDKKERLVVSESQSKNEAIQIMKQVRLEQRKIACEKINSLFGLNVSVDVNEELYKQNDGTGDAMEDTGDGEEDGQDRSTS